MAEESSDSSTGAMTHEDIIRSAAAESTVGNWGLGNEYEIQALLTKYGIPADYITQDFTMDQFDSDSVKLASAMTYNELGLVKNDYDGGYGYGDSVSIIDMNDEGVAMLEDNLFTSKAFAEANPNTVKAFVSASMKGWAYACEHPDEAAEIVFEAGSSVSADHQAYMASEVAKLVTTDMNGNAVSAADVGNMDETAMQQTIDLAKQYIILEDSAAKDKDNDILGNVNKSGKVLGEILEELKAKHKCVGDVRYIGLFSAVELVKDKATREPLVPYGGDKLGIMGGIIGKLKAKKFMTYSHENMILVCPPLIITPEQLREEMVKLDEVLTEVDATL